MGKRNQTDDEGEGWGELKTKYRTLQRFDFLPSLFHFNRSRELSQRQHMHKLCAQIKKSKHCSRLVTSSPRPAQLLLGTLTGMFTQTHTHTYTPHPATHFKTIKQTFFFWLRWIYKKRSFYLKAAAVWTLKSEKTSTKITFKTFQPHNAVGQWGRGGGGGGLAG